jgi:hypothetical protein
MTKKDGIEMKIVDDEAAEASDVVVCSRWKAGMPTLPMPHAIGKCGDCGHAIVISHSSPKKPKKICMECAILSIVQLEEVPQLTVKRESLLEAALAKVDLTKETKH